ncbi:hypothetical protein [Mesorhizobium sp.]|uniref:hypothetical protein n=1 Tax=Mesorhizobium sp. TaxID=1871066 RepID=UPI000FE6B2BF|nr:hypothetical protein [Mesorhizobium sp.]RWC59486.1 MAG: hypothetical protein EOS29_21910 [Mesorhizobium sp.]RWC60467.1 MAG: hypothetical protein EOS56_14350 [Mesorhizobium sp.]
MASVFNLRDVRDWTKDASCTPTALAALTGKTPQEIGVLLAEIAAEDGRVIGPELRQDYAPKDWLKAVNRLGGDWAVKDDFRSTPFADRPTINEWMAANSGVEPELVICDDDNGIAHVFATDDGYVVDTYTEGRRVRFTAVDPEYEFLRVKYSILVEPLAE